MNGLFWLGWATGFGSVIVGQILYTVTEIVRDLLRLRQITRMANERMVRDAELYANRSDDE